MSDYAATLRAILAALLHRQGCAIAHGAPCDCGLSQMREGERRYFGERAEGAGA